MFSSKDDIKIIPAYPTTWSGAYITQQSDVVLQSWPGQRQFLGTWAQSLAISNVQVCSKIFSPTKGWFFNPDGINMDKPPFLVKNTDFFHQNPAIAPNAGDPGIVLCQALLTVLRLLRDQDHQVQTILAWYGNVMNFTGGWLSHPNIQLPSGKLT